MWRSFAGRPRPHASLALRIALASAVFGLIVAGGAVVAGYWTLSQQLDTRAAAELQGRHELLVHILADAPSMEAAAEPGQRFADLFFGHDDLHLALVDPATSRVIASFSEVATQSVTALSHATAEAESMHSWTTLAGSRFSGMHGIVALADGQPLEYFLSVDRQRDTRLLAGFVKATLVALPLLLLIVALGAGLIARTGLAPLLRFNQLAASIGTKSLNQRVSVSGLPAELAKMAVEFNKMLERIDDGYRRLEDFSGDLAHEMRTPVATLLGRTQVALSQTRTEGELREVLEGNVEQLERLSTLISDMLFIARADHNAIPIQSEAVDLAAESRRVAEYMSLLAEEKNVGVRVTGGAAPVMADRLLIQRAITNLVSNAIRHAFDSSTVTIEISSEGPTARLAVTNMGEAIAPAHLERIFDRFYRGDSGRARISGGTGLGLAIVRSIASAHRGHVAVESHTGQTTFSLLLPLETAAEGETRAAGLDQQQAALSDQKRRATT
jgi:two-component system, OmpR family, heavy metal sensor histidine kinase CusS